MADQPKTPEQLEVQLGSFLSAAAHAVVDTKPVGRPLIIPVIREVMADFVRENIGPNPKLETPADFQTELDWSTHIVGEGLKHLYFARKGGPAIPAPIMCEMLRTYSALRCRLRGFEEQLKALRIGFGGQADKEKHVDKFLSLVAAQLNGTDIILDETANYMAETLLFAGTDATAPRQSFGFQS